jgi:hypothetical protein
LLKFSPLQKLRISPFTASTHPERSIMSAASSKPAASSKSVKTPGDVTEDTGQDGAGAGASDPEQLLTISNAQLQAAIAQGVAQALAAQRVAQSVPGNPAAELPDQKDIDPNTITTMTLSKQGYVVPSNYGVPAAAIIKD